MDPSSYGMGNQDQSANQLGLYQPIDVQQWARQREDLRQMKAVIEDAERRMDLGMISQVQQQQTVSTQFGGQAAAPPAPYTYSPGIPPPPPLLYTGMQSPATGDTARIVEIESSTGPPNDTSNASSSNLVMRNMAAPQTSHQVYSRPGPSYMNVSQPGPSNMQDSHRGTNNQPQTGGQYPDIPFSSSTSTPHTQTRQYPSQQGQSQGPNAKHYRDHTQDASHRYNGAWNARVASSTQATSQVDTQPTDNFRPASHGQVQADSVITHSSSVPQQDLDPQSQHGNSRGTGVAVKHAPSGKLLGPISYAIPPGPGQMPLRRSSHVGIMPPTGAWNATTDGASDIALTPGFGPAQAMPSPETNEDPSSSSMFVNDSEASLQTSNLQQRHVNETLFSASSQPKKAPNTLVPVSSSSTTPSNMLPKSQVYVSSDDQLSALLSLNELLASHDQWSDDASNRIIQSVLGISSERPQDVAHSHQENDEQSTSTLQASSAQPNPQSSVDQIQPSPPSSKTQISQIIDSREASSTEAARVSPVLNGHAQSNLQPDSSSSESQSMHTNRSPAPNGIAMPPGMVDNSIPRTPAGPGKGVTATTPSSSSANRSTLAQDILRALQPPSTKRKRVDVDGGDRKDTGPSLEGSPLAKKGRTVLANHEDPAKSPTMVPKDVGPHQTPALAPMHYVQASQRSNFTQWQLPPQSSQGVSQLHPMHYPQVPLPTNAHSMWQPGSWQPMSSNGFPLSYNGGTPLTWPQHSSESFLQLSPTAAGPSVPPPRKQTVEGGSGSTRKAFISTQQASRRSGVSSKPPLFLPSESPPASRSVMSTPSQGISPSRKVPVVELGPSLARLKSKAHLAKGRSFSKADPSSSKIPGAYAVDLKSDVEPLFGRPTGVLAAVSVGSFDGKPSLSTSRKEYRPSGSQVYVLVPKVDTSAWPGTMSLKGEGKGKGKAPDIPLKERVSERGRHIDDEAAAHVADFARRLIRRPCLWKDCQAVLDSAEKLLKHVKFVHGTEVEGELYRCRWTECHSNGCYAESVRLIRHVQWHVNARLYCGYKNCDFQTQVDIQLAEHVAATHNPNKHVLRPYAMPVELAAPEVPTSVELIPAYLSIPLPVTGRPISKDRHQKLGPWVLHRIFGKVDIKRGAVNAAVPLRSQRLLGKQAQPVPVELLLDLARPSFDVQDEYEFLSARREAPSRSFRPLMQVPPLIDEVDMVQGDMLVGDTVVSAPSESVDEPVLVPEAKASEGDEGAVEVWTESTLAETGDENTMVGLGDKHAVGTAAEVAMAPPRGVREEIESREVDELL